MTAISNFVYITNKKSSYFNLFSNQISLGLVIVSEDFVILEYQILHTRAW